MSRANEPAPCVAVVDACSTGGHYVRCLPAGFRCIHIQSQRDPPLFFRASFQLDGYVDNLIFDGDFEHLVDRVRAYAPRFILAGSELGVSLTEDLLARFPELPQNDLRVPRARRDKYVMAGCVADHGLAIVPQIVTDDLDAALAWARVHNDWPVVVKDTLGSGACGLRICSCDNDIAAAFRDLLGARNDLNVDVRRLLVQAYMRGDEYAVNTVSSGGRHYVTDVIKYTKAELASGRLVLLRDELQPYADVVQRTGLLDYTFGVLDALGVRVGPGHTEIMYTAAGPRLLECAARPSGGAISPRLMKKCVGHSQIELVLRALLEPARFAADTARPYEVKCHLTWATLTARHTGTVVALEHLDDIARLASFDAFNGLLRVGDAARETVDLDSVPGIVHLAHPDRAQVDADYACVRALDAEGIVIVAPG